MPAYGFATEAHIKRVIAAVRETERRVQNISERVAAFGKILPEGWYPFNNDTGETVPRSGLLRLASGMTVDNDHSPILAVAKPSTTFGRSQFVNSPSAVPSGEYGICFATGEVEIQYDTGTPAVDETWGMKPGQFTASENYPGFRVRGIIDSTNKIMLAVPEPIDRLLVKAPSGAKVAYNASGTFDVYVGPESSPVDSTWDLSCLNLGADIFRGKYAEAVFRNGAWIVEQRAKMVLGTLGGSLSQGSSATVNVGSDTVTAHDAVMKTGATAIASGKKVYITWADDEKKWYVTGAECP